MSAHAAGLDTLPTEMFVRIIEQDRLLGKADLKALSMVSKRCHSIIAEALWESAVIKPLSEHHLHQIDAAALPQSLFQFARQLHFRSDFRSVLKDRCPHDKHASTREPGSDHGLASLKIDEEDKSRGGSHPEPEEDGDEHPQRFHHLAQEAKSVLERLQHDQLHGFSWDLGTCVPSEVLGQRGAVPLSNPSLLSLSLTTDPSCHGSGEPECEIDLSAVRQLQSLRWRAPGARHFETLCRAIENNSGRLQSLELDFIPWGRLRHDLGLEEKSTYDDYEWCANKVFGLTRQSPQPIFPAIRELCLTQVPLSPAMVKAINFDTLVSLRLRKCPDWQGFLDEIIELGVPIRLKTLEIRDSYNESHGYGPESVDIFLLAFEGLEELFVTYWNSSKGDYIGRWNVATSGVWNGATHHRATLKRLGYHRRETVWIAAESDVAGEGLHSWAMRGQPEDGLSQHPLAGLDLDFIGLSCTPELLGTILLPFASKASLKVLHIRQSGSGLSLVLEGDKMDADSSQPDSDEPGHGAGSNPNHATTAESYDASLRARLRSDFSELAEWAFGPRGIRSLQAIAYGDFSRGGRIKRSRRVDQLVLCRSTHDAAGDGEHSPFRIVATDGPEARVLDPYRDALQALPMVPLLVA